MSGQIEFLNTSLAFKPFSKGTQKLLNWFVFFITFPAVDILGSSITFYLFIALGVKIGAFWVGQYRGKNILILFLIVALVSSILAPSMARNPGFFSSAKILIQYAYWIFVALFFLVQKKRINLLQISKYIFLGTFISVICFYFFKFKLETSIFSIHLADTRNGFVFNMLCAIPISFYYIIETWGKKVAMIIAPIFLFIMLLTDGRSAAVLIILQLVLIISIIYPSILKVTRILVPVLGILFFVSQSVESQIFLDSLADDVETVNPRFASLLRGQEEGDLSFDKSWLIRRLMVDKGIEIFKDFPLHGIGPGNFTYYDSKLTSLDNYERLGAGDLAFFNSRSAHNSYVQILAELGIFGLILMISLLLMPLIFLLKKIFLSELNITYLPLVSLFAISMHFYAIGAVTGAITWIIIGISWGIYNENKRKL